MIKLSKQTVDILSNYSKINSSIYIRPGNVISTVSKDKTILAKATVSEEFDREFAIYDLDELLNSISLFDSPQIALNSSYMSIIDGENGKLKQKYFYVDPEIIFYSDKTDVAMPEVQVNFILTSDTIDKIHKAAGIMKIEDLTIESNEDQIVVKVFNVHGGDSSNSLAINIGENTTGASFKYHIKISNLKLIKGDYTVGLLFMKKGDSGGGLSSFKHNDQELEYFVAIEKDSYYNE